MRSLPIAHTGKPQLLQQRRTVRTLIFSNSQSILTVPAPTSYYTERDRNQQRDSGLRLAKDLAAAVHRPASNRVSAYDRTRDRLADVTKARRVLDLERRIHRKWKAGDVYAPHDLSPVEQTKWQKRKPRETDAFDELGINPLHEYKVYLYLYHLSGT